MPLLERFRDHVSERGLFGQGERVLVGYSGGADSTCLLHLLSRAAGGLGVEIVAGHLHHGQREAGERELKLCEAFATYLGLPFAAGRANVPEISEQLGMGLEEAGRTARYEFFARTASQLACHKVATAHTRNDHVETVLLNLTRGSGLAGLAGIPEVRDIYVRPLLPFSREETRAYCAEHGLWMHDDPANVDISFSRARIRLRVLPELRCVNPAADEAIARLAGLASEEDRYLDAHAVHLLEGSEVPLNGRLRFLTIDSEAAFARAKLRSLPLVPLRRALRLVVSALGGEVDRHQTGLAADGIRGRESGSVTTTGGKVVITWDEERVAICEGTMPGAFRHPLEVPGVIDSSVFGWQIEAFAEEIGGDRFDRDALEVAVDLDRVKGPWHLRSAEDGDKLEPMGFSGTRKLADLMREAGLTLSARRRLPIICDILGVVWAPGVALADRAKPSADTRRGLRFRFGPRETREVSPT